MIVRYAGLLVGGPSLTSYVVNVLLGPNAGPLGRTPLGGRTWEGFSVDPYLSGQLVAESIVAHQDAGVIATLKVNAFTIPLCSYPQLMRST